MRMDVNKCWYQQAVERCVENCERCVWIQHCYRGAGKSLARPARKQATVTEDFDVHISYL